jgi:hypothetical protein
VPAGWQRCGPGELTAVRVRRSLVVMLAVLFAAGCSTESERTARGTTIAPPTEPSPISVVERSPLADRVVALGNAAY